MFKETAVDKLIEYIRALPIEEQKVIAQKMAAGKAIEKNMSEKTVQKKIRSFIAYSGKLPARLPKGYKFDREEANER